MACQHSVAGTRLPRVSYRIYPPSRNRHTFAFAVLVGLERRYMLHGFSDRPSVLEHAKAEVAIVRSYLASGSNTSRSVSS